MPYENDPKALFAYRIARLNIAATAIQCVAAKLAREYDSAGWSAYTPGFNIPSGEEGDRIAVDCLAMAMNELGFMLASLRNTE